MYRLICKSFLPNKIVEEFPNVKFYVDPFETTAVGSLDDLFELKAAVIEWEGFAFKCSVDYRKEI